MIDEERLPNADLAVVDEAKITRYLLSRTHPSGRAKAAFFLRFGFVPEQWQTMAEALRLLATTYAVTERVQSTHGISYAVNGALFAPDGRRPWVRTIWIVDTGDLTETPRFVTAYPADPPKQTWKQGTPG
jgi:hypothetical protein